jgi:hypothetical protein
LCPGISVSLLNAVVLVRSSLPARTFGVIQRRVKDCYEQTIIQDANRGRQAIALCSSKPRHSRCLAG